MLLPNYGVFDEKRVFEPGRDPGVIEVDGWRLGLHICEDSWFPEAAPCSALREAGVEAVINLSASPYHRGKLAQREAVLGRAARAVGAPLLYCNLVGGQDELVFDGASLVVDAAGQLVARAQSFAEDQLLLDLPRVGKTRAGSSNDWKNDAPDAARIAPAPEGPAEVYAALQLGLRDYVDKNGFRKVLVAISGGIDSALVAAIAVDALGSDRVVGVTMPSQYSSHETLDDAHVLARNLGITLQELPIRRLHEEYLRDLAGLWPDRAPDATEENLQARIRGNLIMALSNKFGWLVVTTGNKSEIATGYCTLYGDMAGGFALIKDVPKTLVWELARWRNTAAPFATEPPVGRSVPLRRCLDLRLTRRVRPTSSAPSRSPPSSARPRPSCGRTRRIPTRCRRTTCWTPSSSAMSSATRGWPSWWRRGSTPRWCSACCGSLT
jgi:NAD+ synthase (glutamine-hydrolysing)